MPYDGSCRLCNLKDTDNCDNCFSEENVCGPLDIPCHVCGAILEYTGVCDDCEAVHLVAMEPAPVGI